MMMKVLEIQETIKKPIQIVEKALREGLNVFADMGKLKNIKHSQITHSYTAQFKNEVLCHHIDQAYVTTSLNNDAQTEGYTTLHFRIEYQPNKMHVLQHFWYALIIKPQIKFQTQHILHSFKHRVEKWI